MHIPELDYEALTPDSLDVGDVRRFSLSGGNEPCSSPCAGIKALMLAVLEDGIRAYLGTPPIDRAEAEHWVESSQRRWAFSFNVICETLGLEPSAVRKTLRLLRSRKAPRKAIRRSRPNARRKGIHRANWPLSLMKEPKRGPVGLVQRAGQDTPRRTR